MATSSETAAPKNNIVGEYITFDLGAGRNIHNQFSQIQLSGTDGKDISIIQKIQFLGSNNGNIWISLGIVSETDGYNFATMETIKIQDYLKENIGNLCFKIDNHNYFTNKKIIASQLVDEANIKYACVEAGYNKPENGDFRFNG